MLSMGVAAPRDLHAAIKRRQPRAVRPPALLACREPKREGTGCLRRGRNRSGHYLVGAGLAAVEVGREAVRRPTADLGFAATRPTIPGGDAGIRLRAVLGRLADFWPPPPEVRRRLMRPASDSRFRLEAVFADRT